MKYGICNDVYAKIPIADVIQHAAGLGYHGIELAPFTLTENVETFPESDQRAIARMARDHGIEILGLHWLLVKPDGLHLTSSDPAARTRARDFFRRLMDIAVNTGGRVLTLGSPKQRRIPEGATHADALKRTVECFQSLAPDLERLGLRIGLEPLEPDVTNFMTRTAETRAIADAIGSPAVGLTLDTHFLRWEGATHGLSVREMFDLAGPRLVHLHVQDDNNCAPGSGKADFSAFVAEVKRIRWQGCVCMETFPNDALGTGHEAAAQGIAFMRRQFGPG